MFVLTRPGYPPALFSEGLSGLARASEYSARALSPRGEVTTVPASPPAFATAAALEAWVADAANVGIAPGTTLLRAGPVAQGYDGFPASGYWRDDANGQGVYLDNSAAGQGIIEGWDFSAHPLVLVNGGTPLSGFRNCKFRTVYMSAAAGGVGIFDRVEFVPRTIAMGSGFGLNTLTNIVDEVSRAKFTGYTGDALQGRIRHLHHCWINYTNSQADDVPEWNEAATYDTGAVVRRGFVFSRSKLDGNIGNPAPTSDVVTDWWDKASPHLDGVYLMAIPGETTTIENVVIDMIPEGGLLGGINNAVRTNGADAGQIVVRQCSLRREIGTGGPLFDHNGEALALSLVLDGNWMDAGIGGYAVYGDRQVMTAPLWRWGENRVRGTGAPIPVPAGFSAL